MLHLIICINIEYSIEAKSAEDCSIGVSVVGRAKMQGINWNENK